MVKNQSPRLGSLILRFDDITPGMSWDKFLPLKMKVDKLGIRSVLGVVPDCRDAGLNVGLVREDFFSLVRGWMTHGDTISQHGTFHVYDTKESGILGLHNRSEFAGHPYDVQYNRLLKGKELLVHEGVWQPYFMAPSHSFDHLTLRALHELGFVAITDGYGFYPYMIDGIKLIPQLTAYPLNFRFGLQTLCVHINGMDQFSIDKLWGFISRNSSLFVDFKDIVDRPCFEGIVPTTLRYLSQTGVNSIRKIRTFIDLKKS